VNKVTDLNEYRETKKYERTIEDLQTVAVDLVENLSPPETLERLVAAMNDEEIPAQARAFYTHVITDSIRMICYDYYVDLVTLPGYEAINYFITAEMSKMLDDADTYEHKYYSSDPGNCPYCP